MIVTLRAMARYEPVYRFCLRAYLGAEQRGMESVSVAAPCFLASMPVAATSVSCRGNARHEWALGNAE
jgi:hypothetical protein